MPVCCRMLYLVSFATTVLMAAEVMLLEALTKFCDSLVSTVDAACSCSTAAPRVPRSAEIVEIAAVIAHEAFLSLDAPVERLAVPDIPLPYNVALLETILPTVDSIAQQIRATLAF